MIISPETTYQPTNMFINNCEMPESLIKCNNMIYNQNIQPKKYSNKISKVINPQVYDHRKRSDKFFEVDCNRDICPSTSYISTDPRLVSPLHSGQMLQLDTPPLDSSVDIESINKNTSLDNYGKKYKSYSDINAGQIQYYSSELTDYPYNEPNFVTKSNVISGLFKDPMDNVKPYYDMNPIKDYNPLRNTQTNDKLSWLEDSQHHRENILASQMSKINQTKWTTRWR
jgi:hypothetical protein